MITAVDTNVDRSLRGADVDQYKPTIACNPKALFPKHRSNVVNSCVRCRPTEVLEPVDREALLTLSWHEGSGQGQSVLVDGRRLAISGDGVIFGKRRVGHRSYKSLVNGETAFRVASLGKVPWTLKRSIPGWVGAEMAANRMRPEIRNSMARMPLVGTRHSI